MAEKTVLLSINESDAESIIAKSIVSREQEIFAYELNINVYLAALGNAPSREFSEQLTALVKAERAERDKVAAICNALKAQIDPARLSAAVALAKSGG